MALIALGLRDEPFHDPFHEQPAAVAGHCRTKAGVNSGLDRSRHEHEKVGVLPSPWVREDRASVQPAVAGL